MAFVYIKGSFVVQPMSSENKTLQTKEFSFILFIYFKQFVDNVLKITLPFTKAVVSPAFWERKGEGVM